MRPLRNDDQLPLFSVVQEPTRPIVVDDFPHADDIQDDALYVLRNCESRYLTHTFHKYAGKFVPHVPRWALRSFLSQSEGALVLDPFVGSGTTLVEALLEGQNGIGIDVDPLARLITKVKTTPIPNKRLAACVREIEARVLKQSPSDMRPEISTLNHWFTPQAVDDLSAILSLISEYKGDVDLHDFLIVCFSSIIRRASNADNQTMKTYVSHTHPKIPEPARRIFLSQLMDYSDRLLKFSRLLSGHNTVQVLANTSAKDLGTTWHDNNLPLVDLVVTSPPYIKSVDYIYNQMAELFWIGKQWGLETQPKQNEFKRRYIGHDRPDKRGSTLADAKELPGLPSVNEYIGRVAENDAKLGITMRRYFQDMHEHFASARKVLKPGGHYVLVVGDSTLGGISVPTHDLLIECAAAQGFRAKQEFGYEIRNKHMRFPRGKNGGVVIYDWIIDFQVL